MHLRLLALAGVAAAMLVASFPVVALESHAATPMVETLDCADQAMPFREISAMFIETVDTAMCDPVLLEATGLCLTEVPQARAAFAFVPLDLAAGSNPGRCPSDRSPFG